MRRFRKSLLRSYPKGLSKCFCFSKKKNQTWVVYLTKSQNTLHDWNDWNDKVKSRQFIERRQTDIFFPRSWNIKFDWHSSKFIQVKCVSWFSKEKLYWRVQTRSYEKLIRNSFDIQMYNLNAAFRSSKTKKQENRNQKVD